MNTRSIRIGTLVSAGEKSPDYIRQILPHGFESFSITFSPDVEMIDLARLAREVKEVLANSGAIISSLGIYGNSLLADAHGEACRAGWQKLIDAAALFDCRIVAGFAGRLAEKSVPDTMPRFAEVFDPLARQAADKGVRLAFENCPVDWNMATHPAAWERMFNSVQAENIGLQWEPCHQLVQLMEPLPQLRRWAGRIFHVHGKDASIRWDVIRESGIHGPVAWWHNRTPGFGDSNWTDIISELRMAGYTGTIDIEGWHDPVYRGEWEMTGQVAALNYLKRCRGGDFIPNPV